MNRDPYRSSRSSAQQQRISFENRPEWERDFYPRDVSSHADTLPFSFPAQSTVFQAPLDARCATPAEFISPPPKLSRVQAMKLRLDELEPRVCCIAATVDRLSEATSKFGQLLSSRSREAEELENGLIERICRSEQRLQCFSTEVDQVKQDSASDLTGLRQMITQVHSEVTRLKTWILENLRQIHGKLDMREKEQQQFKVCFGDRLSGYEKNYSKRANDLCILKAEVDAKFAAVKEALSLKPTCRFD